MPADSFTIKQHDTLPALERTLKNSDGSVIDLTNASVRFHMKRGATVKVDASVTVVGDATEGNVKYSWQSTGGATPTGDTDTPGEYDGEFEVTFAGGDVITVPNDGYMLVTVEPQLA